MQYNTQRPDNIHRSSPRTFKHLIGQENAVSMADRLAEYAHRSSDRFPHSIMVGPPGTGKTLLAKVIAKEMGSQYFEALGQNLNHPKDLIPFLLLAHDRDVILIDEADEMPKKVQTALYRAVEDGVLFAPGAMAGVAPTEIPLERVTILIATNYMHRIVRPLRDRFKTILEFGPYSDDELIQILRQRANTLDWRTETGVVDEIARRAQGIPRRALRILDVGCMLAVSYGEVGISMDRLHDLLDREGIDQIGLDRKQRALLEILAESCEPVRLNVLAARLDVPQKALLEVYEPFLIRQDLMLKTDEGRLITPKGLDHVRPVEVLS